MTTSTPRTAATSDDMSLAELMRPLSAKALPRSAMTGKHGDKLTEAEAQARASMIYNNQRAGRRGPMA